MDRTGAGRAAGADGDARPNGRRRSADFRRRPKGEWAHPGQERADLHRLAGEGLPVHVLLQAAAAAGGRAGRPPRREPPRREPPRRGQAAQGSWSRRQELVLAVRLGRQQPEQPRQRERRRGPGEGPHGAPVPGPPGDSHEAEVGPAAQVSPAVEREDPLGHVLPVSRPCVGRPLHSHEVAGAEVRARALRTCQPVLEVRRLHGGVSRGDGGAVRMVRLRHAVLRPTSRGRWSHWRRDVLELVIRSAACGELPPRP
mmetsp:Transcript_41489/g.83734  ORF Transcript_41489/g.83734 Transcript_41489/m.83734 type:complete len:256 (-) Transcript_41489:44-811(-)